MKKVIFVFVALAMGVGAYLYSDHAVKQIAAQAFKAGRASVTLKEVCQNPQDGGFSANFETGEYYEIVKCQINVKHDIKLEDVFMFEDAPMKESI